MDEVEVDVVVVVAGLEVVVAGLNAVVAVVVVLFGAAGLDVAGDLGGALGV